jgi:hypothetical protein
VPLAINTPDWFFTPTVDANRSVLYFESNRSGGWLIYESPWNETTGDFEGVFLANGINSEETGGNNGGPYAVPNGSTLYFHTSRTGSSRLGRARRNGDAFDSVEVLENLGTAGFPVVAPDELALYASVCDPDLVGQCDIRVTTRASKKDAFGEFTEVIGVNTAGSEVPSFISADGCRLYFDRNSSAPFVWGMSDDTAYVVEREPSD